MKVMKFGGTSVKDASRIRGMLDIVRRENLDQGLVVVCSAMKGVTDDLIKAATMAAAGDTAWQGVFEAIRTRHAVAVDDLLATGGETLRQELAREFAELGEILHGIFLIRECSLRTMDLVSGFGERLNNRVVAAFAASTGLRTAYVDARTVVVTDDNFGAAAVQFDETYSRIKTHFDQLWGKDRRGAIAFATGFVAATRDGISTTLGRNGSDYSASIFGAGLDVDDIEIWTDVDGAMTCDPRIVPKAFVIDDMSVEEAMEMSYFGAEVIHPSTMVPAVDKGIPLWIKNTMNPTVRGTRIAKDAPASSHPITGLAVIKNVALISVVGGGMIGAKGTAMNIFAALYKAGSNVIMISQASSEHSVCVVVKESEAETALRELNTSLAKALETRSIQSIDVVRDLEILSAIGANMRGRPGVAGKLFAALGDEKVNILAIAQGSGEMNISCVIESRDRIRALNAVHAAFFPEV